MPVLLNHDIQQCYNAEGNISVKDYIKSGLVCKQLKPKVAELMWYDFMKSWSLSFGEIESVNDIYNIIKDGNPIDDLEDGTFKNLLYSLACRINLNNESGKDAFMNLANVFLKARKYKKRNKVTIELELLNAYNFLAVFADAEAHEPSRPVIDAPSWNRVKHMTDTENYVIFSDHHMTAFTDNNASSISDYFYKHNYNLYLEVLEFYADSDKEYCLVENGDVEECIITIPTVSQASSLSELSDNDFPIEGTNWSEFLDLRYSIRESNLNRIFNKFSEYYNLVNEKFGSDRYIRLSGNHDTYLDDEYDRTLKEMVESKLPNAVQDILRISHPSGKEYMVMHGHQFDSACLLHGMPFARSLGETFSESLSWAFEGPDRFWGHSDTMKLYVNEDAIYSNVLSTAKPKEFDGMTDWHLIMNGLWEKLISIIAEFVNVISETAEKVKDTILGLLGGKSSTSPDASNKERIEDEINSWIETSLDNIRTNPEGFFEQLLGDEIAWEYFENSDAFEAFALEIWRGDEFYKIRHMNETELCSKYRSKFKEITNSSDEEPTLILGHTHEPRFEAKNEETGEVFSTYINTGSAGRYQNLIWCVEIDSDGERIVSWSKQNNQLKRVVWRSKYDGDRAYLIHDN